MVCWGVGVMARKEGLGAGEESERDVGKVG